MRTGLPPGYLNRCLLVLGIVLSGASTKAQSDARISGNFSTDIQFYNEDEEIGAIVPPERMGANAWLNLIYSYRNVEVGGRLESYEPALIGYPAGQAYEGTGLGFRYVRFNLDKLDITVGNFFEQFGSGMVFRSFEERYLGVDNAMDGVRLKYEPYRGVYLTGVLGKQRFVFNNGVVKGDGTVRGINAEVSLRELLDSTWTSDNNLLIGGSFVSRYQEDRDPLLVLPENVGAWSLRANYTSRKWNLYSEYAYKINDPNVQNGFIYKPGQALLVSGSYSGKGLGISAGAHAFDNMFFQSDRASPTPFDLNINFLPPLAKQHTYNLPATLYPYATQPNGEVSTQAEVFYKWKKGTRLGGKHGTRMAVNYSVAWSLDSVAMNDEGSGKKGYTTRFFRPGEDTYFQDVNIEIRKKLSSTWELAFTYLNLIYDIDLIQGKPGKPVVHADIAIVEGLYNFSDKNSLRFEAQHLSTKQDQGNWVTLLAEVSFSPSWFVAIMDQYNYVTFDDTFLQNGKEEVRPRRIHYPIGSVGFLRGGNRFQMTYGRQRAGIFCVGGICREVPAANGLTFSVLTTF